MKKMLFVAALVAALFSLSVAQDVKVSSPSVTAIQHVRDSEAGIPSAKAPGSFTPCNHAKTNKEPCVYYAGDFDSTDSNANGLYNADNTSGDEGQVWVGVKPKDAFKKGIKSFDVTDVCFNEFFESGYTLTNPSAFAVQTGTKLGTAGKTVCTASGTGTLTVYGESDFGLTQESFCIKWKKPSCLMVVGKKYYVNALPTASGSFAYLANAEDLPPAHHYGWANDPNDCFFNGAAFGDVYVTCDSQGIGTDGFSVLSISLSGTSKK